MKNFLKDRLKSIEILIVDDAPENLRTLTRILKETDYHVTPASSGEEALEIILSNRPDLILLDVKMPGIDGFEVCKRVKADNQTSSIPIIFISALDQMDDKKKGFELGASDYILKPFHGEEVILRINNLLKISILQETLLNNAKREITKEKENAALTKRLIEAAENYLQSNSSQIDYQKINDEIWEISGAKIVTFNLFNEEGEKFTTTAISGDSKLIKIVNSSIKTKMLGKQWDNDLARYEKIKEHNVTKFDSLKELAGDVIGKPIIELIEKTFGLGAIYLIKIMRNEVMLGDFTILMAKNVEIKNLDILEIYTRQLGLFLSRIKEEEYRKKQTQLILALLDATPDIMFYKNTESVYIGTNKVQMDYLGKTREEIIGKTDYDIFDKNTADRIRQNDKEIMANGLSMTSEQEYLLSNGDRVCVEMHKTPYYDKDGQVLGVVGIGRDITERKLEEEQIRYLSFHDQLTGLYNRRFYEEELKRLDTQRNYPLTLLIADCNGLKLINDSFGHQMGDELIKRAGYVMKQGCRSDDIVARLGGDEFVAILPKTEPSVIERIIAGINGLAQKESIGPIELSIAIGYSSKNDPDDDIQTVFKRAEDFMYKNKLYESNSVRSNTIDLIMNTLFEKSSREMIHSKSVSEKCVLICNQIGLSKDETNKVRIAGLMHDIGKISLDVSNLSIKESLTKEEVIAVRKHSEVGYRLLSTVNEFSAIADFVLQHHERWDGKGYPAGLKKDEISLPARIISVADAFDSMTNRESYKRILTQEEAFQELRSGAGTQFDPDIVEALLKSYEA